MYVTSNVDQCIVYDNCRKNNALNTLGYIILVSFLHHQKKKYIQENIHFKNEIACRKSKLRKYANESRTPP